MTFVRWDSPVLHRRAIWRSLRGVHDCPNGRRDRDITDRPWWAEHAGFGAILSARPGLSAAGLTHLRKHTRGSRLRWVLTICRRPMRRCSRRCHRSEWDPLISGRSTLDTGRDPPQMPLALRAHSLCSRNTTGIQKRAPTTARPALWRPPRRTRHNRM